MSRLIVLVGILLISATSIAREPSNPGRYFYEGDGTISLYNTHTGKSMCITYRDSCGDIVPEAIKQINAIFGVPQGLGEDYSLRTLSFIDYLEDQFSHGKVVKIVSGYRSPAYNANIRKRGGKAAETSYHLDAMAADVIFPGVEAEKIWDFARELMYGGVGFYGGSTLHLDSGKPRFWTSESAISKTKEPPLNRNIYLSIDKDIYKPGEEIRLFFSGISNYPIGVRPEFKLDRDGHSRILFRPKFDKGDEKAECVVLNDHKAARAITWKIPTNFDASNEAWKVEVDFCAPTTEKMPLELKSRSFLIREKI